MDQGEDAVHVREILEGRPLLRGPATNIEGIYAGPLWYYFQAVGYALLGGHPAGGVVLLIGLNVALTAILMMKVKREVGAGPAVLIGGALQFYWPFFDVSRYGFNPFPLVFLTVVTILLILDFLSGKKNALIWAAVLVGLAFHAELAGAMALFLFYAAVFLFLVAKGKVNWRIVSGNILVLTVLFLPLLYYHLFADTTFLSGWQGLFGRPGGVFTHSQFILMLRVFLRNIGKTVLPFAPALGLFIFLFILAFYFLKDLWKKNIFVTRFVYLVFFYLLVNWLWFGSNVGWRIWHTVAIPVVLFIALVLVLTQISGRFFRWLLVFILAAQLVFFVRLYGHFLGDTPDPSILRNEIAAIDWVYQHSEGKGFYVYNYLPSVRDYSHQYLFWWYGRKKYGYLPCEYSSYPGVPDFFVPNFQSYQNPVERCSRERFLIIEPGQGGFIRATWLEGVTDATKLVDQAKIGQLVVQKRILVSSGGQ